MDESVTGSVNLLGDLLTLSDKLLRKLHDFGHPKPA